MKMNNTVKKPIQNILAIVLISKLLTVMMVKTIQHLVVRTVVVPILTVNTVPTVMAHIMIAVGVAVAPVVPVIVDTLMKFVTTKLVTKYPMAFINVPIINGDKL